MSVGASSNVTLATSPGERILFQGNGGDGIDVDGSYFQVNFGSLTVQNNLGAALVAFGGRVLIFGGDGGENIFQNNGEGIDLFDAASATFFGKNTSVADGFTSLNCATATTEKIDDEHHECEDQQDMWINPPNVYELTSPSNHRISRITKIVQSIVTSSKN